MEYNGIKEAMLPRAVYKPNIKDTDAFVCREVKDIAIVLVGPKSEGTEIYTNADVRGFGVDVDEVVEQAFENLRKLETTHMANLGSIFFEGFGDDGIGKPIDEFIAKDVESDAMKAFVITNNDSRVGAIHIFKEDILEKLEKVYDGRFNILPSSIHEVITMPYNEYADPQELISMVQEINAGEVRPAEWLSQGVFYYDPDTKEIKSYLDSGVDIVQTADITELY